MSAIEYVPSSNLSKYKSNKATSTYWTSSIESLFPVIITNLKDGPATLKVGAPHNGYSIETHLRNGRMHGKSMILNSYQIRIAELNFVDGEATGECSLYNEDGFLFFRGSLEKGVREGKGKEYYPNGKLLFEGYFHQGFRQGKGIEYNENGEGKEAIYERGVINVRFVPSTELKKYWVETDTESGSRVLCQTDDLGKRFGICYFYLHDTIQRVSRWKDGAEIEILKSFNNNKMIEYSHGVKVYEGEYANSMLLNYCRYGKGMEFLSNGTTMVFNGSYRDGKRNGTGIAYHNNSVVYKGLWVNGYRLWCVIMLHEFYVILFFGITAALFFLFDLPFEFWFIIPILFIWRRVSLIRCEVDYFLANHNYLKRHFIVGNGCCNCQQSLTIHPYLIKSIEIGNDCFKSVKTFQIDGLNQLKSLEIRPNSFTLKKNTEGNDESKSFHILNCESLESIQIGRYSFSDFGGEFELKNLPQLQFIHIGTIGSDSFNFPNSSFVIQGIDLILNI